MYVGRVWLCYTEAEVWNLTPRKFYSQIHVHEDVMKQMHGTSDKGNSVSRQPLGYIDQIKGW